MPNRGSLALLVVLQSLILNSIGQDLRKFDHETFPLWGVILCAALLVLLGLARMGGVSQQRCRLLGVCPLAGLLGFSAAFVWQDMTHMTGYSHHSLVQSMVIVLCISWPALVISWSILALRADRPCPSPVIRNRYRRICGLVQLGLCACLRGNASGIEVGLWWLALGAGVAALSLGFGGPVWLFRWAFTAALTVAAACVVEDTLGARMGDWIFTLAWAVFLLWPTLLLRGLESRVDGLALHGQDPEDALVDPAEGFVGHEALQPLQAQAELPQGQ